MFVWCLCGACVVFVWCLCGVCVVFVWCLCGVLQFNVISTSQKYQIQILTFFNPQKISIQNCSELQRLAGVNLTRDQYETVVKQWIIYTRNISSKVGTNQRAGSKLLFACQS